MSLASTLPRDKRDRLYLGRNRKPLPEADVRIRLADIGVFSRTVQEEDLVIQRKRVSYILEETIQKLKLAITLRQLIKNDGFILRYFAKPLKVFQIIRTCSSYLDLPASNSPLRFREANEFGDESSITKSSSVLTRVQLVEDPDPDPDISHVLETLWNIKELREKVLADLKNTDNPICFCFTFINAVKLLGDVTKIRLHTSAVEEKNREKHLQKSWKTQASLQQRLHRVVVDIELQRGCLGLEVKKKKLLVSQYKEKIEQFRNKYKAEAMSTVVESEAAMQHKRNLSTVQQEELAHKANTSTLTYDAHLATNLSREKTLRKKRLKIETQLCNWLDKYNADIGERQNTFDELTKGHEAEKIEYAELKQKFKEQEEDYVVLMAEKEEEWQRVFEERLYVFVCNRAVRRIQRNWRAYRQRKLDRKQKKGKGKAKKDTGKGNEFRGPDPSAFLDKKFGGGIFDELKGDDFNKKEVKVEL